MDFWISGLRGGLEKVREASSLGQWTVEPGLVVLVGRPFFSYLSGIAN
jgi:hypothetical protein